MSNITVRNLTHRYAQAVTPSVKDISFVVPAGSFCTFLGPNGAGKSTTISVLTTALAKTRGKVEIAGLNLDTQAEEIRSRIGIIFQKPEPRLGLDGRIQYPHSQQYLRSLPLCLVLRGYAARVQIETSRLVCDFTAGAQGSLHEGAEYVGGNAAQNRDHARPHSQSGNSFSGRTDARTRPG